MEFTRNECIKHVNALRGALNIKCPGSKPFAVAVYKNSKIIDAVMAEIQKHGTPTQDPIIDAYEKARDAASESCAKMDKNGKPERNPMTGQFTIDPEKTAAHEEAQKALIEEHKEAVEKIKNFNEDFDAYMKEKIDIVYHRLMEHEIPTDNISANDLMNLDFMLVMTPPKEHTGPKLSKK